MAEHNSTGQESIKLTPDQLAKVIDHAQRVKTDDGRGLNHYLRNLVTAAIVDGEQVHTVCGVSFYPRAVAADGSVTRAEWPRCHACWMIWWLETHHGVTV